MCAALGAVVLGLAGHAFGSVSRAAGLTLAVGRVQLCLETLACLLGL